MRALHSSRGSAAALAVAIGCALPAAAQPAEQSITLLAVADEGCTLSAPELTPGGVSVNFSGQNGNVYRVQELSDPARLTTRAARLRLNLDAMCNGIHRVVLSSQNSGLWREAPAASGATEFGTAVPYQLELSWAELNRTLSVQAAERQELEWEILVGRSYAGEIELDFSISAGATNAGTGAPMLSGGYTDVVTVRVEPQ